MTFWISNSIYSSTRLVKHNCQVKTIYKIMVQERLTIVFNTILELLIQNLLLGIINVIKNDKMHMNIFTSTFDLYPFVLRGCSGVLSAINKSEFLIKYHFFHKVVKLSHEIEPVIEVFQMGQNILTTPGPTNPNPWGCFTILLVLIKSR